MIKRLFFLINLGLITLGLYFGVSLFYQVLVAEVLQATGTHPHSGKTSGLDRRSRKSGGGSKPSFNRYQAILERDLFKTAESSRPEKKEAEAIELEKLEETELNLRLWGTVTGSTERAYAVIEDKSKRRQGLYHKGDAIQDATIKMILRKKVVLRVNGKDEILVMEDEKRNGASRAAAASGRDARSPAGETGDSENIRIERSEINSVLGNINQLMRQAKVRPYFRDGKPSGLLLTHIRRNSIFTELGLKSGDIVKGVNGKPIQSVDDALEFYNKLKNSSSVQLEIERRGQTKSLSYQIF
jgi:general secretion pathway protein C